MNRDKILLVDDDKDFLNLINAQLKESGYQVVFASDVPSAVMMARRERPGVILLDIALPGGDGFLVIDRLKAIDSVAHIPIIVLTAKDPAAAKNRALEAGAYDYLHKPVDKNRLLVAVQRSLGSQAGGIGDENGEQAGSHKTPNDKILVVDDDKNFLQLLNVKLRGKGYEVAFATDVPTALSTVQKEQPDLILLDIGLPGGDGFILMSRLKAMDRFAHIPIVVISGNQASSIRARALNSGADAFLEKPIDHDDLGAAVHQVLGTTKD